MACKVIANRHGRLTLSLHWLGRRSWEGTGLVDTKLNRERLQRLADAITAEIRAKQFTTERYHHYFSRGNRLPLLELQPQDTQPSAQTEAATIGEYYAEWIERQCPPLVRPAQHRDYQQHFDAYLCAAPLESGRTLSDLRLDQIRPRIWLRLRDHLLGLSLKPKTAKNILGSLRALVHDARERTDFIHGSPFATMKWTRTPSAEPEPFDAKERDRIVEWFRDRKPHYYPFVLTLFRTGMRPSEATALRWADIDIARGTIAVRRSRYQGAENAPKTRGSNRTVYLVHPVREALRVMMPLHARPDDYVFVNELTRGPIDQGEWAREFWHRPLRALNIRARKFYATRHTFISIALTAGVNLKWLAEQCGNSVAMIERHYGRFLAGEAEAQLRLLEGEQQQPAAAVGRVARHSKPSTHTARSTVRPKFPLQNEVVPTGIEPVLPT